MLVKASMGIIKCGLFQNAFWNDLKVAETHSVHTEENEASFRVVQEWETSSQASAARKTVMWKLGKQLKEFGN